MNQFPSLQKKTSWIPKAMKAAKHELHGAELANPSLFFRTIVAETGISPRNRESA